MTKRTPVQSPIPSPKESANAGMLDRDGNLSMRL